MRCKCKRKRRSHVDRKCKEGKICRRSQAQSKFFFKMADDSEALVAISLLFVVFLYRVLKGWRIKTYPEVPHLLLHLSKQKSSSVYFWIVCNFYHITLGYLLTRSANFLSGMEDAIFFSTSLPRDGLEPMELQEVVCFVSLHLHLLLRYLGLHVWNANASARTWIFFISFVCVCICVDVVHTYIS